MLNRIGETNLPEGIDEHTVGVSLKRANNWFKRFTLVDIAGFQAPVQGRYFFQFDVTYCHKDSKF